MRSSSEDESTEAGYVPLAGEGDPRGPSEAAEEERMPGFSGLVGLYAVQIVASFDNALVLPSMYLYIAQQSRSEREARVAYGVAQTVYFVFRVIGQVSLGWGLDGGLGYREAMAGCLCLGAAGSLAYVCAPGVWTIIAGRGLLGLGSSLSVVSLSFVATFVPKRNRTKLIARMMGLQRASTPLAPLVILGLAKVPPTRAIDALNAPGLVVGAFNLAGLSVVLSLFREPERVRRPPPLEERPNLCEVLRSTGAWVSSVLSFQNNWNNQVLVWTMPLLMADRFGPNPTRDAFLFASGGVVGLCTAFGLSRRKLCATDRATIVTAQLGVGFFLAAFALVSGCGLEPTLPLVWLLFSFYYAPFIAQMPANNAMYSKLISHRNDAVGKLQSVLEVSKSSARAFAGLAIGQAYAAAGPCGLWLATLALWLAQFLPLALVWPKLYAADAKLRRPRADHPPDHPPDSDPDQGGLALVPRSPPFGGLLGPRDDRLARLNQGFVEPHSPTFIHFSVGGEAQML